MVRPSRNASNARRADLAARMAAGKLTDAERDQMVGQLRDALLQVSTTLRDAGAVQAMHPPMTTRHAHSHHAYDGADGEHAHVHEHQNDANHAHSHAELDEAASSAERARQGSQSHGRHVRLTRDGAQVLNSAFQQAADDLEGALPPEWRQLYRDIKHHGSIG